MFLCQRQERERVSQRESEEVSGRERRDNERGSLHEFPLFSGAAFDRARFASLSRVSQIISYLIIK